MSEYLAPGVYVEEIERGPRPIEGVSTSTAAFLGRTERGSVQPRLVTSYTEYLRTFGGVFDQDEFMPHTVNAFFENGGRRVYICRITGKNSDGTPAEPAFHEFDDYRVSAIGPESWGKRIFVKILASTTKVFDKTDSSLKPIGIRLQIAYWPASVAVAGLDPFVAGYKGPQPAAKEDFDDIVLNNPSSSNHYSKRIGDPNNPGQSNSNLISFSLKVGAANPPQLNVNPPVSSLLDQAGDDGVGVTSVDYSGNNDLVERRTALAALLLDPYREVALVYAPNANAIVGVIPMIISHCENQRFRFAVIDADQKMGDYSSLDPRSKNLETPYAAFYYPWITVSDSQTGARIDIPPGGAVLGIYARTDSERGVFKAPANEGVRGALELEYHIDDSAQETLNPRGVNAIRAFPGRGIRVWGARTLSANTLWKYVSVRRLFIFLERSIYEGTQWVVFEPNDEGLWARVKDTIRLFLRAQFRAGALMGATEAEAFSITCDRTVMTQDDILNGRLVCEIGIAAVKPAEFVIFRIFQLTAEAQT